MRKNALVALALSMAVVAAPSLANASPVGTCPADYTALNQEEVSALPDAELALIAYASVNHNGDDLVCYRAYRNGPHNGGYTGNFIDNTAAPHTG